MKSWVTEVLTFFIHTIIPALDEKTEAQRGKELGPGQTIKDGKAGFQPSILI
jgi:hypothetical protein